jgi:SAM-dependent methyltransferase
MHTRPANLAEEDRNRFREALVLVRNEFTGLGAHEQYMNAFSRLLKWDPLGRVTMMGTDQRDQFVPVIKSGIAANLPRAGSVLDIGCGDGQTFSLIADAIPAGSVINGIEPNEEFLKSFEARLADRTNLKKGSLLCSPFTPEILAQHRTLAGSTYDLITIIHVLYFFENLEASLLAIYDALSTGATAFIVFADELAAYTGLAFRAFLNAIGENRMAEQHAETCRKRLKLFATDQTAPGTLSDLISRNLVDTKALIEIQRQETRLYGHSLTDIIALCNITGLEAYLGLDKFDAAADLIEHEPESVDFRIENDPGSPRYGTLSVSQPQIVAVMRKTAR